MTTKTTRAVEMYRLWPGGNGDSGTWDTDYYDIPIDTPDEKVEEVALSVARATTPGDCAGFGIYSIPELDDQPDSWGEEEEDGHWRVTMSSDECGSEEFTYDTEAEANAGVARLRATAEKLTDGIQRTFAMEFVSI